MVRQSGASVSINIGNIVFQYIILKFHWRIILGRQQQRLSNEWQASVAGINDRRNQIIRRFYSLKVHRINVAAQKFGRLDREYLESRRLTNNLLSDPNYIPRGNESRLTTAGLTSILDQQEQVMKNLRRKKRKLVYDDWILFRPNVKLKVLNTWMR